MKSLLLGLLRILLASTPALALGTTPSPMNKKPEAIHIAVLGGLANVNQYTQREVPFWTQTVPKASNGRITTSIRPYDQAGLTVTEPFRLIQLGVIPFANMLLGQAVQFAPEIIAPDLAGQYSDMGALRRSVAAFRPYMARVLRENYRIEVLAIYAYPAQVLFCRSPVNELADLKGLRVRTSSMSQADFVEAMGATSVSIPFAELKSHLAAATVDCAVTGTMSGNGIGLHQVTSHLYSLPVSWALSIFAANLGMWQSLPEDVRQLIQRELQQLEADIWSDSERETTAGFACNTGESSCVGGQRGKMKLAIASNADKQKAQVIFKDNVLGNWIQRCGDRCKTARNDGRAGANQKPTTK